MRYRYLDDLRRGISVFAIFSYGIAVLGTPQCPPQEVAELMGVIIFLVCFLPCSINENYKLEIHKCSSNTRALTKK